MRLATEERETDTRYASSGTAHRPGSTPSEPGSLHVLIAGAGPAGVEAALTLERIAGGRVVTTVVAPEARFVHFPPAVLSPFGAGNGRRPALDVLTDAHVRLGTLDSVDSVAREVRLRDGETLCYDALLIAVGGIQRSPYPRALAFGSPGSEERMHGLIQDLEGGFIKRIAFVVPSAASWPLPIYELALMTAERAYDMCLNVELTLVTSEPSPLALFGEEVSRDVALRLAAAGIAVKSRAEAEMPRPNALELHPSGERLEVDRVVTVPVLDGPAIDGLPYDAGGFLPVDAHGRVIGAPGVYAAGDATDFEIKQGGIACQQADAAAEAIAACAGVAIDPRPFAPVLRGILLTEHDTRRLQRDLDREPSAERRGGESGWPRTKFLGRELSGLLDELQAGV
jgi:sulfide:quinone oxidoreductase